MIDEIGQGGMATVYRAQDLKHDRPVALKVLKPELAAVLGTARFLREIALTARLDHPHVVPLLDSGEADGLVYYVMPLVQGESLRSRIAREKQLPIDEAVRIAREVAAGLAHAHQQGVIHRDIKPENVLLSGGHARIADFGIARAVSAAKETALTQTGLAIGTPVYMSPEQASGERELDARTDVYSLGAVLYEMLSGQPPFTGATAESIMARKAFEPVPGLRVVRDTVPPLLEAAVNRALARVPADRFATAGDFAAALTAGAAGPTRDRGTLRPARWLLGVAGAAGLVAAAALLVDSRNPPVSREPAVGRITSLAVLPLENLSPDPDQDYLADGMHEALIIGLGRLSGLERVSARPSVLRFRTTDRPLREIARELGVGALIAGTVQRAGGRVKVTASLIDPASGSPVWSESYERELEDVLTLQNEIVAAIARQVAVQLSPREQATLGRTRRVHPEAWQAYLRGKAEFSTFTPAGFERALARFREAIRLDPEEPLAYAGLAQAYTIMELIRPASSPDDLARARAAAERAIQLDESLAEAHLALSIFRGSKEYDHAGAEHSVRRAIELNPHLAEAHIAYAQHLSIFGSEDSAMAEWTRGVELDPLSPLYAAWMAGGLWEFNRLDESVAMARKALELEPDFPLGLAILGLSLLDQGKHREAVAAHEALVAKYPGQGFGWTLARTYARSGDTSRARRMLESLTGDTPVDVAHPWFIAAAWVELGRKDQALDWLEKAYQDRIMFLVNLRRDRAAGATFKSLWGEPRFEALLAKLKLGPPSSGSPP